MSCDFQAPSRSFRPAPPSLRLFTSHESPVTCYEISRRPSPFRSATYKMLFPQLLCFENDPSFMGGGGYPRRWRFRVLLGSASRLTISLQCVRVLTSPVVGRMAASISEHVFSLSRHRLRRWAQLISPGGNRFCRADHSFDEQAGKQLTV